MQVFLVSKNACKYLWQLVTICDILWWLVPTCTNLWRLVTACYNLWQLVNIMQTCKNFWQVMKTCDNQWWQLVRTGDDFWRLVTTHYNLWQIVTTCDNLSNWKEEEDIERTANSWKVWQTEDRQTDRQKTDGVTDNASTREACASIKNPWLPLRILILTLI